MRSDSPRLAQSVLRAARSGSGMSQYELADALRVNSGNHSVDRDYVKRWENGSRIPTPYWRRHLVAVLGVPARTLDHACKWSRHVRTCADRADSEPHASASEEARASTLVGTALTGAPADEDDANAGRLTVARLVELDNAFGGDNTCDLAVQAFRSFRRRLACDGVVPSIERDLLAVAAELGEVAGWMSYDADRQRAARRLNHEALALARVAGDRSMELLITQNMAMQAGYLGQPREALWISRSVLEQRRLTPRLTALFRLREARALAQTGEANAAQRVMAHVRTLYAEGLRDDDPAWAWWVNEDQLAIQHALCHDDVGDHAAALDLHHEAVELTPADQPRGRYINLATLLRCAVAARAWSDAIETIDRVVPFTSVVGSRRTVRRLRETLDGLDSGLDGGHSTPPRMRAAADELRDALDESGGEY